MIECSQTENAFWSGYRVVAPRGHIAEIVHRRLWIETNIFTLICGESKHRHLVASIEIYSSLNYLFIHNGSIAAIRDVLGSIFIWCFKAFNSNLSKIWTMWLLQHLPWTEASGGGNLVFCAFYAKISIDRNSIRSAHSRGQRAAIVEQTHQENKFGKFSSIRIALHYLQS